MRTRYDELASRIQCLCKDLRQVLDEAPADGVVLIEPNTLLDALTCHLRDVPTTLGKTGGPALSARAKNKIAAGMPIMIASIQGPLAGGDADLVTTEAQMFALKKVVEATQEAVRWASMLGARASSGMKPAVHAEIYNTLWAVISDLTRARAVHGPGSDNESQGGS